MDKIALITGASGGIGSETARVFSRAGYQVVLHYHRNQKNIDALLNEILHEGGSAISLQADFTSLCEIKEMVDQIIQIYGHIDVLVSNAGISWQGLFTDMTPDIWQTMRSTNLDSTVYLCQCVYPHMVSQKAGRILTVSSMWGQVGASCEVGYSITKAGIIGLTRALARELAPSGITVNCVAPGVIDTPMNGRLSPETLDELTQSTPLGRLGTPTDVAHALLFFASEEASFITGQVLGVDGGFL